MTPTIYEHAGFAWLHLVANILEDGRPAAPRDLRTWEVPHASTAFAMTHPHVICSPRRLSYRFMAAEALWILAGDDRVETIAPYNRRMAEFSDDGIRFFGAYGPRIAKQLPYVVAALRRDRWTRQAVLTIWRESPPPSKDVPCTVALSFDVRGGAVNCHVFMRSSDAWLGVPYDFFTFSMVALRVASLFNDGLDANDHVGLGTLYFTAASSHLYETNLSGARNCVEHGAGFGERIPPGFTSVPWSRVVACLEADRDQTGGLQPWSIRGWHWTT
jgi:thymidylate synthase